MIETPPQFVSTLLESLSALDIPITSQQLNALSRHYAAMVEANRVMNLTRMTDPAEAAVKHYADSLAMLRLVDERVWPVHTLLDIGTGAGFPAIPLAIMRPKWNITAMDGTRKKIEFVGQIAKELTLTNLRVIHAHSAHWKTGENFDLVTGRAVAKLGEFLPQTVRFLVAGGHALAYQTASATQPMGVDAELPDELRPEPPFHYELRHGEETLPRTICAFTKN